MATILPFVATMADNLLGFGSNLSANQQNMKMNRENLQAAKDMQQMNFQFQRDMYEDSKAYNSPASQRSLYEQAGLNPYAMMSEGSFQPVQAMSGGNGSVPSMHPIQSYQPNFSGAVNDFFDSRIKEEQIETLKYQNDMKELTYQTELQERIENIMNKRVKTEQDYIQLRLLRQELSILESTKKYKISQSRADAERSQVEADRLDFEYFMSRITSSLDYAIRNNEYNISYQSVRQNEAEIQAAWQNVSNLAAEGQLTNKLIKKTSHEIASIILKNEHDKKAYPKIRRQIEAQIRATNRLTRKQGPMQIDWQYNESTGQYDVIQPHDNWRPGPTKHR